MRVFVGFTGTSSTTSDFLTVLTQASATCRRFQLYDLMIGSPATPADNAFGWQIRKKTVIYSTGGAVDGPSVLDTSDVVASTLQAASLPTTNATGTTVLMEFGLNQRATYRWVAAPGGELVAPGVSNNGFALTSPSNGGAVNMSASLYLNEL